MTRIHIIWGESPEPGDKPVTYQFASEAEAEAFRAGIEASMGWFAATEVANAGVRVNRNREIADSRVVRGWSS